MESLSVMVVDDDPALQRLIVTLLLTEGYRVVTASSAEEALSKSAEETIDLVITDIDLPGMDGLAMMHELKERDPAIPVIVVTGSRSRERVWAAYRGGAADYLQKPFTMRALSSSVRLAAAVTKRDRQALRK